MNEMSQTTTADGNDEEAGLLAEIRRNEAYESSCRARMWALAVPAFATIACIVCLYVCEDCLFGVMLFCVVLCFKDAVLVLVFVVSLALLIVRHPIGASTTHRVMNAGYALVKPE
jgi:hypothetical protein